MIKLNIMGGLGNQMFQYAYARALSQKLNDSELHIYPYAIELFNLVTPSKALKPSNSLLHFKLNPNVKFMSGINAKVFSIISFLHYSYDHFFSNPTQSKFKKRSEKGLYIETTKDAYEYYLYSSNNPHIKRIIGYFCNEMYIDEIREILVDEFKVKTKPTAENAKMIEELSSCNSVCVHIRRGDYLLPQNSFLNVVNEQYYKKAMKYICEHTTDPVFYIFSNTSKDLEWVKTNYHFDYPVIYVDLSNPDYEELRLMYSCKHFILCNSSFSWWGAFLSESKDKIIVSPNEALLDMKEAVKISVKPE